ncbi:MAG TPA: hypothetical protein VGO80_20290 [Solirubrobacteraceae bacterium]|jgi:hypothetical protein|nr:hypothetical protein [Solirubrobacteraceae bacterium]
MHEFVVDCRLAIGMACVIAVAGCAMPSAAPAFTADAETVPASIAYYGPDDPRTTRELEQRLHLRAAAVDEHLVLSVSLDDGPWSPGAATIEGGGTLGAPKLRSAISATSVTSGRGGCQSPTSSGRTLSFDLLLPAGTSSTISFSGPLRLGRAPAGASAFVQRWELARAADGPTAGSSAPPPYELAVRSPSVTLAGVRAASVTLRVGPTGSARAVDDGERLVVRARRRLTVSGHVSGAQHGDSVMIWRFSPGTTVAKPLARVHVDRHERFRHSWRPRRRGPWDLYATYAGHPGLLEAARSPCGGPRVLVTG